MFIECRDPKKHELRRNGMIHGKVAGRFPCRSNGASGLGRTWFYKHDVANEPLVGRARLLPSLGAGQPSLSSRLGRSLALPMTAFRFIGPLNRLRWLASPDEACGRAAVTSTLCNLRSSTLVFLLAFTVFASGCASNGGMSLDQQKAYIAGQEQALSQMHGPPPSIHFEGQVKNDTVPWQDGLTLSQAIVAAVYDSMMNPRRIQLVRQGETIDVDPKELLQGNDMPLQPGDVVKIMR